MSLAVAATELDVDRWVPASGPHAAPAVDIQLELAQRLAMVAEYRDDATGAHATRVAAVSGAIARELGLPRDSARLIELAAPLHDLGKVAIADAILLKRAPLTPAERAAMQQHTVIGARMLDGSTMPVLRVARAIALSHHERWDGGGYPQRLSGAWIPLPGRIVAIADVFDALTSDRPYKRAWPLTEAIAEIRALRGSHFDASLVDAFMRLDHGALLRVA
jgi:putative two-component system response regulator